MRDIKFKILKIWTRWGNKNSFDWLLKKVKILEKNASIPSFN